MIIVVIASLAALAAAFGVLSYRYPWWRPNLPADEPRILCYHMVDDRERSARAPRLAVSPARFEQQVRYLARNGWRFLTMSQLLESAPQPKTVALTFDDGYRDNLTQAAPILKRYGACATVYVIANRTDPLAGGGYADGTPFAPLLSDRELKMLEETDVFEIGSHTMTHRNLAEADDASVARELNASRETLQTIIGTSIRGFAYPYGAFEERLMPMVQSAGYDYAVRGGAPTGDLDADRYRLGRIRISGKDNFLNFLMKIHKGRKR
ncbi:MAG: polysaccharide deacetylase family protein [Gammaproteobacteria bacterium]|nr:MAG: polysaccharide deacetylase family protein [Gammaproteobacteria bacterium]